MGNDSEENLKLLSDKFVAFINETHDKMSHDEINHIFFKHFEHKPFLASIPKDSKNNFVSIYRITIPFEGMDHEDYKSYSYAPPNIVEMGRANLKGHPVFYGSTCVLTALLEMKEKLELNSRYFVSKWKLNIKDLIMIPWIINNSTTKSTNPLNSLSSKIYKQSLEVLNNDTIPLADVMKDIGNIFSERGKDYYHITGSFSYDALYEFGHPSILLFPSVERNNEDINVAIPMHVADNPESFLLEEVFEFILTEEKIRTENTIQYKLIKKATFHNNSFLKWETTKLKVVNIDFKKIEFKLYNDTVLKGEASLIKLKDSLIPTKEIITKLITEHISKYGLPEQVVFSRNKDFITNKSISKFMMFLQLNHGYKYPLSEDSYSCIKFVQVPIDIEMYFQSIVD